MFILSTAKIVLQACFFWFVYTFKPEIAVISSYISENISKIWNDIYGFGVDRKMDTTPDTNYCNICLGITNTDKSKYNYSSSTLSQIEYIEMWMKIHGLQPVLSDSQNEQKSYEVVQVMAQMTIIELFSKDRPNRLKLLIDHLYETKNDKTNILLKKCIVDLIMTGFDVPNEDRNYDAGGLACLLSQSLCISREPYFFDFIYWSLYEILYQKETPDMTYTERHMIDLEKIVLKQDISNQNQTDRYPVDTLIATLNTIFSVLRDKVIAKRPTDMEIRLRNLRNQLWSTLPSCYPIIAFTDKSHESVMCTQKLKLTSIPLSFDMIVDFKFDLKKMKKRIQHVSQAASFREPKLLELLSSDYVQLNQLLRELERDFSIFQTFAIGAILVKNTHNSIRNLKNPWENWNNGLEEDQSENSLKRKEDWVKQANQYSVDIIKCNINMIRDLFRVASEFYKIYNQDHFKILNQRCDEIQKQLDGVQDIQGCIKILIEDINEQQYGLSVIKNCLDDLHNDKFSCKDITSDKLGFLIVENDVKSWNSTIMDSVMYFLTEQLETFDSNNSSLSANQQQ